MSSAKKKKQIAHAHLVSKSCSNNNCKITAEVVNKATNVVDGVTEKVADKVTADEVVEERPLNKHTRKSGPRKIVYRNDNPEVVNCADLFKATSDIDYYESDPSRFLLQNFTHSYAGACLAIEKYTRTLSGQSASVQSGDPANKLSSSATLPRFRIEAVFGTKSNVNGNYFPVGYQIHLLSQP